MGKKEVDSIPYTEINFNQIGATYIESEIIKVLEQTTEEFCKTISETLAGVTQWIELWPVNQKVTGSITGQGACLGCGPGPQWGLHERQPHIDVFLSFSLPSPLSKNK